MVFWIKTPNYFDQFPIILFKPLYLMYLISYSGLVKWYNNGLQNLYWVFDRQADIKTIKT